MKHAFLITLLPGLVFLAKGCTEDFKARDGTIDGGYFILDVETEDEADLVVMIDNYVAHKLIHSSTSSSLNGFIEEPSSKIQLEGTSESPILVTLRFGGPKLGTEIVVFDERIEEGDISVSWCLPDIRATVEEELKADLGNRGRYFPAPT